MGGDKAPRPPFIVAIQKSDDIGPYTDWPQLAGYFDGDGSISIRRTSRGRPFTLLPALEFGDMSRRQIRMVKEFLLSRGIRTGKMTKRNGAWRVEVGTIEGVTRALTAMMPFLFKKKTEAGATLDYLTDKISGNELQRILRAAVRRGDRERVAPFIDLPWTRSAGAKKAVELSWKFAGGKPPLGPEGQLEIIRRFGAGQSQRGIARSMGISRGMVRRAVSRHTARKPRTFRRVRA
jgi:hypothetical protein